MVDCRFFAKLWIFNTLQVCQSNHKFPSKYLRI